MQRGWRETLIGIPGSELHVQLSCRQGETGAGQLEGKGEDLCQRHGMYPMERQTGCKTETQPIETKEGQIKTENNKERSLCKCLQ